METRAPAKKTIILLLEDEYLFYLTLAGYVVGTRWQVVWAQTVDEAMMWFLRLRGEIGLILVDGNVGGCPYDTKPFVRFVKESGFTGEMISISLCPNVAKEMLADGCTSHGEKVELAKSLGVRQP
ncbi:MAG: hypothetical protein AAB348_02030 [Patescibacteria group bacterium]